jgi:copper chaperone
MIRLSVPDMSCGHCHATVQAALGTIPGVRAVRIEPADRTVSIEGTADPKTLIAALAKAGYAATPAT